MKTFTMLIAAAGLALSIGCSQEESKQPAPKPETAAPTQTEPADTSPTGDEVAIADSELPVAADFEEDADREINADNYAGILDELEGEIASE